MPEAVIETTAGDGGDAKESVGPDDNNNDKTDDKNEKIDDSSDSTSLVPSTPNPFLVGEGDSAVDLTERIYKRSKALEERRQRRKKAEMTINKFPGLDYDPEMEAKKREIYARKKEMLIDQKEEAIEIFEEVTEEMEEENFEKRREIEDLFKKIAEVGTFIPKSFEEEVAKQKLAVDEARSDLSWAKEELKKVEHLVEREKEKYRMELTDHAISKRRKDRLLKECEKRNIYYSTKNPDGKLKQAQDDVDDLREKRDTTNTDMQLVAVNPSIVPVTEKGMILEEREKMLRDEVKESEEKIEQLRREVEEARDFRDDELLRNCSLYAKYSTDSELVLFSEHHYDEKFQRWVDQKLGERPGPEELILPHVKLAAYDISRLWKENIDMLLERHKLEDRELEKDRLLRETEQQKKAETEKPELEKKAKHAQAEIKELEEMNKMLQDFLVYLADESKKDAEKDDEADKEQELIKDELLKKKLECDELIRELEVEIPNARAEIERYREILDKEDKRRGEDKKKITMDDDERIREIAKQAVKDAKPREKEDVDNKTGNSMKSGKNEQKGDVKGSKDDEQTGRESDLKNGDEQEAQKEPKGDDEKEKDMMKQRKEDTNKDSNTDENGVPKLN